MQKTYSISANFGEITKDLDDRIQKDSFKRLRDNSLEEMTNVMPDKYFLAKSVNGVELEYFILGKPSKAFTLNTNGVETVFHIYEDRIITAIPSLDKIFIDTIPEDILVDVNSVDTAFIISNNGEEDSRSSFKQVLTFNSSQGIYKAPIIPQNLESLENSKPYFYKIEIPKDLEGQNISSKTANLHIIWGKKDLGNRALPMNNANLDEEITGIYYSGALFNIGDILEIEVKSFDIFLNRETIKIYKGAVVQTNIDGLYYNQDGSRKVYPRATLPTKITQCSPYIFSPISCSYTNIPDDAQPIKLSKLDVKLKFSGDGNIYFAAGSGGAPDKKFINNCVRYGANLEGKSFEKAWFITADLTCETHLGVQVKVVHDSATQENKILNYSAQFLDGRLVVSSGNVVKFSKVNEPDNFNFTPDNVPTESDAFFRTITDVNEIFWLYKWGDIYKGQGIAIGTPQKIVYFSSVATLFNTSQIDKINVPCSRIKPIQITVQGNPANLVVLNGRRKISATIFTRDQNQQIPLTDAIDFFETDPIKKIQSIQYGEDQLLFTLTDAGKIYGCLTGGDRLAWFRIQLQYPVRDIATSDYNGVKKLFIVSLIGIGSDYDAVGSINFTEGVKQVSAEYYTNLYMPRSYDFSTEIPKITGVLDYKQKKELTEEEKHKIVKPMQASLTFHNMEVINSTVNTLSTNTNREISNVVLNVKDTNLIRVNYKIKFNGREEIKKEAFTLKVLDDNFNTNTLRETIKIYKNSMSAHSVKLNIETLENSTIPTTIKSISFDTKYAIK